MSEDIEKPAEFSLKDVEIVTSPVPINEFGDSYIKTTGRHGPDISSQRPDDLDKEALDYVHKLVEQRKSTGTAVRVLDLGGGTGGQSKRFAQAGAEVTLVDLSDQHDNLRLFNEMLGRPLVNFIQADMSQLNVVGLSQKAFDVIYTQRAIGYLRFADAKRMLTELIAANQPSRMFVSAVGMAADDVNGYAHALEPIESRFAPLRAELAQAISAYEPLALYWPEDMHKLLESAGAKNIRVWLSASGNVKATATCCQNI